MIKITKNGNLNFSCKCPKCDCEFTYNLVDVKYDSDPFGEVSRYFVKCPECAERINHDVKNKLEVKTNKSTLKPVGRQNLQ